MARKSIRDMITIEEVLTLEPGLFENILYDGDLATKQNSLDQAGGVCGYLYLIHPVIFETKK